MGCCSSKSPLSSEVETSQSKEVTCKTGAKGPEVSVVYSEASKRYTATGSGVVIGSCPLDCDSGRWEVVIGKQLAAGQVQVGVRRYDKKHPCSLVGSLSDAVNNPESPAWLLQGPSLKEGDIVGIFWDQTDLPMLSFSLNGQRLPDSAINRIRPSQDIYPAISLESGASASFVFEEEVFTHPPIANKFKMVLCSTSII